MSFATQSFQELTCSERSLSANRRHSRQLFDHPVGSNEQRRGAPRSLGGQPSSLRDTKYLRIKSCIAGLFVFQRQHPLALTAISSKGLKSKPLRSWSRVRSCLASKSPCQR